MTTIEDWRNANVPWVPDGPELEALREQLRMSLLVPQDFNGHVVVARPAQRIPARDVKVGDVLLLDGYVTRVDYIDREESGCGCTVFHFHGSYNVFRGWHEIVSVIRPTDDQES